MTAQPRLLIVEDDREIGSLLCDRLTRENFETRWVRSGVEMDVALDEGPADLVILDLMLPGEDGLSICRRLRATRSLGILMLTAKHEELDRIIGLEVGADDYLAKPFSPRELVARIRAVLRRIAPAATGAAPTLPRERVAFDDYLFDISARELRRRDGSLVDLSTGDYELLTVLVHNPQRVLTRDQLMDLTRGRSWDAVDRSIDVALSRLRRKIEIDPAHPSIIKTVRNGGYLLAVPVTRMSA